MRIRGWVVVVVVPAVLGLGACGEDDGGGGVASAGSGAAAVSASASPSKSLSPEDAQLKFAQCMRQNGIDVPDPGSGANAKNWRLDVKGMDKDKVTAALEKCRPYMEAGGGIPDPKDPKVQDQRAKFAQCMREHGVDMPDPGPDGNIKLPAGSLSGESAQKALDACQDKLPGGRRVQ